MKKTLAVFAILAGSVVARGQTVPCNPTGSVTFTPNLQLQIPATNACNWQIPLNANWGIIDSRVQAALNNSSPSGVVAAISGQSITPGSVNGIIDAAQMAGADIGAKINAAVAALPTSGGTIIVPALLGGYTFSTPIVLDNTRSITLQGAAAGSTGGAASATEFIFTGASGPVISAKSTASVRITGIQFVENNAGFSGDIINTSHSGAAMDSFSLEIDHNGFFGSGATATNILNLDDTISSSIHDNTFQNAQVAILGANSAGHYANALHIYGNHFSSSTGTITDAMIRNLTSGGHVDSNTFEIGATSVKVLDFGVQYAEGIQFDGNWIGDMGASFSGTLFGFLSGDTAGITVSGNMIGGNSSATVTAFEIGGSSSSIVITGNFFSTGFTTVADFSGSNAVKIEGNFISGGAIMSPAYAFSGTNNFISIKDNLYSSTPSVSITGAPSAGVIQDARTGGFKSYGSSTYLSQAGAFSFPDTTVTNATNAVNATNATNATNSTNCTNQSGGTLAPTTVTMQHLWTSENNPSISSGFGTGASILSSNGVSAFTVGVGAGGVASTGVLGTPQTASAGWICNGITDRTTPTNRTIQTGTSTTTITLTNYNAAGTITAWGSGDILTMSCFAY